MGWLEASVQAQQSQCPVLFVYADEPVPAVYGEVADPPVLHAVAALLHAQPVAGGMSLRSHWQPSAQTAAQAGTASPWEPASFLAVRALQQSEHTGQHASGWSWERV